MFVAVPVGAIADAVVAALDAGAPLVTDVGSVKAPVGRRGRASVARRGAARFVGGHPMAGSEQEGVDGADADLFVGATWVAHADAGDRRTAPTPRWAALLRELQAEVVAVTPEDHDELVAFVSHVPQLAASTLMDVATDPRGRAPRAAAARGRRLPRHDADRRGHPAIWPDILTSNRDAVLGALDAYLAGAARRARYRRGAAIVTRCCSLLGRARPARRNLPVGISMATKLVELRIPVPDRPGVLAEVTTLAGRLGVNVADVEIAHSTEGGAGVIVLIVAADDAEAFETGLRDLGYHTVADGHLT